MKKLKILTILFGLLLIIGLLIFSNIQGFNKISIYAIECILGVELIMVGLMFNID